MPASPSPLQFHPLGDPPGQVRLRLSHPTIHSDPPARLRLTSVPSPLLHDQDQDHSSRRHAIYHPTRSLGPPA
ncbi:hypothetical protein BKA80DRAFT_275634 [Phyllosticta citrichinensis]